MITSTFSINLDLPYVEVLSIRIDQESCYHLNIRSTETEGCCHVCKAVSPHFHGYDREITVQHLPILGKSCYLHMTLPRFRCDHCPKKPTTTLQPSWRRKNSEYTTDFEDYILKSLMNSTVSDVSYKEGISEGVISRLLDAYISTEIDWKTIEVIGQLGIDEISIKKGHKDFVTIITSRSHGKIRLLAILKDRKKATVIEFFESIPKPIRKTIFCVCSDFYEGFINAAKEVLGKRVRIVIDRFHLAKLYRKGLDTLRKKEMALLKKTLEKSEYAQLDGVMWALRKPKEKRSEKEKRALSKLFSHSGSLKKAAQFSDELTQTLNTETSRSGGIRRLKNWALKVGKSDTSCFDTFLGTLEKRVIEIANYFVRRENSGFVEGFNNRIKVLKRRCYGIIDRKYLYQRLSLDLGI
jgi:transposase